MKYLFLTAVSVILGAGSLSAADVRLTNDISGGYVSAYTLATGTPYTDAVITECSKSRSRQNEPAVAVDPRDTRVLVGSSNDYCGVYAGSPDGGPFQPTGPIWLGYYRSETSGTSFQSSLVPGYPGDTSPYAALARVRTAGAGDPVIAWDGHGRAFFGAEASDDPAGSKKTFGDVWVATFDNPGGVGGNTLNDGKRFVRSVVVAKGTSAPNFLGKFHDKTSIEADRTGGACDGNVYFAWARFNGNAGAVAIFFSRSTDHGATWSSPAKLTASIHDLQDPDIAVTGNGNVYVTYHQFPFVGVQTTDSIQYVKSTDCGKTFAPPQTVTTLVSHEAEDRTDSGAPARDCGDGPDHCQSGYTFFRGGTTPRSTADQFDASNEWVHIVYDAAKPGTEVDTGTTFGWIGSGRGAQSGAYYVRLNGATGAVTTPVLIDDQPTGHQRFPDISADGGVLHVLWWDSRLDPSYSTRRPIGNDAAGNTAPSIDAWGAVSNDHGATWTGHARLSGATSNPNYEQFDDRQVPFGGDYLWITSFGTFSFGAWTDWRDTVAGPDPREGDADDNDSADVTQCRTQDPSTGVWSGDQCPHLGGLDQNIYGSTTP